MTSASLFFRVGTRRGVVARTRWVAPSVMLLSAVSIACSGDSAGPAHPPVASVSIRPLVDTADVPDPVVFAVTARDGSGATASGNLSFAVSDTAVAAATSVGATCRNVGTVQVTATVEGISTSATLACMGRFTVVPVLPSLFPGDTLQLDSRLATRGGTPLVPSAASPITWRSSAPAIATVSATGLVTSLAPGQADIIVQAGPTQLATALVVLPTIAGRPNREITVLEKYTSPTWFSYVNRLVRLMPDGSGIQYLTGDPDAVGYYRWSADGTKLLITDDVTGVIPYTRLEIMDADGSNRTLLDTARFIGTPVWSPDKTRIAYARGVNYEDRDIWVLNVTTLAKAALVFSTPRTEFVPEWSPDGRQLLAVHRERDFVFKGEILVWQPDGSGERVVPFPVSVARAIWSPDGKHLAVDADDGTVWITDPWGRNPVKVSPLGSAGADNCGAAQGTPWMGAAWSPNGRAASFVNCFTGEVRTVTRTGTPLTAFSPSYECCLLQSGIQMQSPWSPDGTLLINAGNVNTSAGSWLIRSATDGTSPQSLAAFLYSATFPRWRP